jgi:tetratricopeptide (TPR) repeat protein
MKDTFSEKAQLYYDLNENGILLYKENKYEEAIQNFKEAIQIDDTKEKLYFNKGRCEDALKHYHNAIKDFEKGLSINSKEVKYSKKLAVLYKKIGRFDKGIKEIDKLLLLEPGNAEYKEIKESIQKIQKDIISLKTRIKEKNYSEIEKLCKKILNEAPQAYIAQKGYIYWLLFNSKYKEILSFVQDNVCEENKNIYKDLNFYLALSLSYECEFEKAKELLNKLKNEEIKVFLKEKCNDLLKIIGNNEKILNEGDQLTKEGKYKEAVKLYEKALENKENSQIFNSKLLSRKGLALYLMDENEKASEVLNQSTIINPDYSLTFLLKGMINTKIKAFGEAEKDFEEAKKIDSSMSQIKEITTVLNNNNNPNSDKLPNFSKEKNEIKEKSNKKDKEEDDDLPEKLKILLSQIPCVLKLNNNGIERYDTCLEKIKFDKMRICNENRKYTKKVQNKENKKFINDDEIALGLSIFKKGADFKNGLKKSQKYESEETTIIAKSILYSIILNKKDIKFKSDFIEEIKEIADLESSNEERAKKLEELFQNIGLYIPLKLYIGGLYTFDSKKMNEEQKKESQNKLNADIKLEESIIGLKNSYCHKKDQEEKFDFSMKTKNYIGGEMNKDYEEWLKSVNLDNSDFIEYSEFREIFDFLDINLQNQLREPINMIKDKYNRKMKYVKTIEEIENNKGEQKYFEKKGNLIIGKFKEEKPDIICLREGINENSKLKSLNQKFIKKYEDIIVGLSILNNRIDQNDNKNGNFSFENPLLKNEINIEFKANINQSIDFLIKVYIMKYPD